MTSVTAWWGNMSLQRQLQFLIQGFLIVILGAAQHWVMSHFESQALAGAEARAIAVADGTINGLNTLMITKADKDAEVISNQQSRMQFIEKMGASEDIKEMRVIRAKQLDSEFPEGLPQEYAADDTERRVLASGKTEYALVRNGNGEASLRTVVPFIAKKEFRGIKCLECHGVEEGFVLGAASVTIDVQRDLAEIDRINAWAWGAQLVLQVILFAVIGAIVRHLLHQLGGEPAYAMEISRRIADGDLSSDVVVKPGDESSLLANMKHMQEQLRRLVGQVLNNVHRLNDSVTHLASSAEQVAAASSGQSQATVSMASAIEQITGRIATVANNATNAQRMAQEAGRCSGEGHGTVQDAIVEMSKISESVGHSSDMIRALEKKSSEISGIVNVIKEIADQTNLLALNAAIEAARAGEQGRGFAVVADEVRKLAERTRVSTQEIATMIDAIQDTTQVAVEKMNDSALQVAEGTRLAERAGESMNQIDSSTERVREGVDSISSALREQSNSANLLAQEVEKISQKSEMNSALAAQAHDAARELEGEARELAQAVSQFKI